MFFFLISEIVRVYENDFAFFYRKGKTMLPSDLLFL